jgi:hypothetical protein
MNDENLGGGASRTTDPAAGTSSATDVSLREYFNEKIASDRQINRERFRAAAAMGAVIWFFIERHLSDLNHENARILKQQESTVSSDTYNANEQQRDKEADELGDWRKEVDRDRTNAVSRAEFTSESKVDKRAGLDTTTKLLGAFFAAAILLLGILNYTALHRTTDTPPATVTVTTTTTP